MADRICQIYNATLTLLHVIPESTTDKELAEMNIKAEQLIQKAIVNNEFIIQKSNDAIDTISKISAGYDLLILGTPQKDNWKRVLFGTGKDKFTEKSACSVLRLTIKES